MTASISQYLLHFQQNSKDFFALLLCHLIHEGKQFTLCTTNLRTFGYGGFFYARSWIIGFAK